VSATISPLKHKINVNTLEHTAAAERLELNDIGRVRAGARPGDPVSRPIARNRALGGFILIDRLTNSTVGAGLINFALRRSQNVHWQALDVDKPARSRLKGQKACVLWLTGSLGRGAKSTIANRIEKKLTAAGRHTYLLDGDNVRHGLNKGLRLHGPGSRRETSAVSREVSRLMVDAGPHRARVLHLTVPLRAAHGARAVCARGSFFEVFVDTPLAEAERRDVKGLYRKARRGELKNFTGIDSPYEAAREPGDTHRHHHADSGGRRPTGSSRTWKPSR